MSGPVVGIDLDNTIATYDGLFHRLALEHGLIDPAVPASKRVVRDAVRRRGAGDLDWQRLQACAYGALMPAAAMASGVAGFLARCRDAGVPVYVISHRTEFAPLDPERVPLRVAALDWMRAQGLFGLDGLGLREGDVLFGATRAEKIACIARVGCTHFIDDLEEVLLEPAFPERVVRILYAPDAAPALAGDGIRVAAHWDDVHEVVFGPLCGSLREFRTRCDPHSGPRGARSAPRNTGNQPGPLPGYQGQSPWLAAAGEALIARTCERLLGRSVSAVHRINGGRNNQVFRVDCDGPAGPARYAAKHYFAAADDVRDRLGTEYGALRLLRAAGIGSIPAPVAVDRDARCAVYEFLPGTPAGLQPASDDEVRQAVAFLSELRRLARRSGVEVAAAASEACFSIAAVVAHVGARADLLRACKTDGPATDALHRFIAERLTPSIAALTAWTAAQVRSERLCADRELPLEERTLSPSDFGFHNAVRDERGRLAFLDFEYFGWDDPAKTIADFLLHPAIDVTAAQRLAFAAGVLALFAEDPRLEARGRILYPWFGLKWALILLNEFLPGPARRRRFAGDGEADREQALRERLRRAGLIVEHVDAACRHNPFFAS